MEEIPDEFNFIKAHFLPPNVKPLLQPMDQQVIANFKKLYTKALFWKCFEANSSSDVTSERLLLDSLQYSGCCFLNCGCLDVGFCHVLEFSLEANVA
jgi:hypothetical protein